MGNGCLQDILFRAGLNPRKKLEDWSDRDGDKVFHAIKDVMADMTEQGGRDTEKDLLGNAGAVSYTHLDVYKRQGCLKPTREIQGIVGTAR